MLLLFVLIGCTKGPYGTTIQDSNPASYQAVQQALSDLSQRVSFDRGVVVTRAAVGNGRGEACMGCSPCIIRIDPSVQDTDAIKTVVYHEYGHCAGLGHDTDTHEIMSPDVVAFTRYTDTELQYFFGLLKSTGQTVR